ncbi:MAG: hypothetical protein IJW49_00035 [Clostridia bacterium]|nr:hypothetical protein [Clostridia bacterium]
MTEGLGPLAVLGGDERQLYMCRALALQGYLVRTWGLPPSATEAAHFHRCSTWEEAIRSSRTVILPLPASKDGVHVNAQHVGNEALRLDILLANLQHKLLLGGKLSDTVRRMAEENCVRWIDYYDSESLQLKNALATAEGAIEIAMRELPVTLDRCHAAIIGFGRIGELLAQKLGALGVAVTVYARREEALTRAALYGCSVAPIQTEDGKRIITRIPQTVRLILNTVPQRLLTRSVLQTLPRNCLLIDLASAPGGVDFQAAQELNLTAIWATALPGKYAPESAGTYLAETVASILSKELYT